MRMILYTVLLIGSGCKTDIMYYLNHTPDALYIITVLVTGKFDIDKNNKNHNNITIIVVTRVYPVKLVLKNRILQTILNNSKH